MAVAGVLLLAALLGSSHLRSYDTPAIDPSPALLPIYLLRSLARLATAYAVAVLLALATGHLAARSRFARRLILPTLDVLQSVPILGFFPAAVAVFIGLFGGSALGVEAAAVFLIFTSMFWNLAFSVYESLITFPEELTLAAAQFGLRGPLRWSRVVLPAVMPNLVYNSILSWANGWYFLTASEIIAAGPARYTLPGLGSYLAQAITVGRNDQMLVALLVLLLTTVAMHLLVWSPLDTWAERFHLEETGDRPRTPRVGRVLGRSRIVAWAARVVVFPAAQRVLMAAARLMDLPGRYGTALAVTVGAVLARERGVRRMALPRPAVQPSALRRGLRHTLKPGPQFRARRRGRRPRRPDRRPAGLPHLPQRPHALHRALHPPDPGQRARHRLLPPDRPRDAAAGPGHERGSILLVLTGTFFYVMFNVLSGAAAIPRQLHEAAAALGLRGPRYVARVFLPAVLPSLVTGCVTAWGGGWNAIIFSEYMVVGGRRYEVQGIGAMLDRATYVTGDQQVIALSLLSMVVLVVLVNRVFWQPVYQRVAARYKMES